MNREQVVLLDEVGQSIGTADKVAVHDADTPLHLAFSCYLFDGDGSVLVTRRAWDKRTFPGVRTNSCCGHPAPGESIQDAVHRRVRDELGLELSGLKLVLPQFQYRAEMDSVVENEMCPVFVATASGTLDPDPAEVAEAAWLPWAEFRAEALAGADISSWCHEQMVLLPADPFAAPARSSEDLPSAAR